MTRTLIFGFVDEWCREDNPIVRWFLTEEERDTAMQLFVANRILIGVPEGATKGSIWRVDHSSNRRLDEFLEMESLWEID